MEIQLVVRSRELKHFLLKPIIQVGKARIKLLRPGLAGRGDRWTALPAWTHPSGFHSSSWGGCG